MEQYPRNISGVFLFLTLSTGPEIFFLVHIVQVSVFIL